LNRKWGTTNAYGVPIEKGPVTKGGSENCKREKRRRVLDSVKESSIGRGELWRSQKSELQKSGAGKGETGRGAARGLRAKKESPTQVV